MSTTNDVNTQFFSKYTPEQIKQIFGPGSSSLTAHQLSRRDPQSYAEMKIVACYRDRIVPESSLPRASRLTKEQLDEGYRRDRAALDDESIAVPDALCDRVALPRGSRVKFDVLQKLLGRESQQ
jgi:hypothetical protein